MTMAISVPRHLNALGALGRYSMTPAQQRDYLVLANRFAAGYLFRCTEAAQACGYSRGTMHTRLGALAERGWVAQLDSMWQLTHPVMTFRPCREQDAA